MEFEDSYWGWQHLLDYVFIKVKERTLKKMRTRKGVSVIPKEEKASQ